MRKAFPKPGHLYEARIEARWFYGWGFGLGEPVTLRAMGRSPEAARQELERRHGLDYRDADDADAPVGYRWADVAELTHGQCAECERTRPAQELDLYGFGPEDSLLCIRCALECDEPTPADYPCLRAHCRECGVQVSRLDEEYQEEGLCLRCSDRAHRFQAEYPAEAIR